MIAFLLALLGGLATPFIDAPLTQPLARLLERYIRLEPGEVRVVSLLIMFLLLGALAALLTGGSPFWIALGVTLGYFGLRIVTLVREQIDARRGD